MTAHFDLKRISTRFKFHFRSSEGETILASALYSSKQEAERGMVEARGHAAINDNYDRRVSALGEPFFALTYADGKVLALSEMFPSRASMETAIAFVKQHAVNAPVEDRPAELKRYSNRRLPRCGR